MAIHGSPLSDHADQPGGAFAWFAVEVFPGISAFDTLLIDLGIDIAANGIQMYEATDLLIRRRPIQNDVACLIWQPTVTGDPTCPSKPYPASNSTRCRNTCCASIPMTTKPRS